MSNIGDKDLSKIRQNENLGLAWLRTFENDLCREGISFQSYFERIKDDDTRKPDRHD